MLIIMLMLIIMSMTMSGARAAICVLLPGVLTERSVRQTQKGSHDAAANRNTASSLLSLFRGTCARSNCARGACMRERAQPGTGVCGTECVRACVRVCACVCVCARAREREREREREMLQCVRMRTLHTHAHASEHAWCTHTNAAVGVFPQKPARNTAPSYLYVRAVVVCPRCGHVHLGQVFERLAPLQLIDHRRQRLRHAWTCGG